MNTSKVSARPVVKIAPLSYERLAILTVVARGPIMRADISAEVVADTVGAIALKKSTAHYLINQLNETNYIEIKGHYFYSTPKGWRALHQELARIENQRRLLKQRLHV